MRNQEQRIRTLWTLMVRPLASGSAVSASYASLQMTYTGSAGSSVHGRIT